MLAVGDRLPDFSGHDVDGHRVDTSVLAGRPLVLFFYPKANSLGCTREARAFAEHRERFERRGARVVGVSVDAADAQRAFAERCRLPYSLISDSTGELARRFGVLGAFGLARRVTFVVDAAGRIRHVTESLLPATHVKEALIAVEELGTGAAQI